MLQDGRRPVIPRAKSNLNVHRLGCTDMDEVKAINRTLLEAGLDATTGVDPDQVAVIWDKERAIEDELGEMQRTGEWAEYGWDTFQDALYGAQDDHGFWTRVKSQGRCTVIDGNTRVKCDYTRTTRLSAAIGPFLCSGSTPCTAESIAPTPPSWKTTSSARTRRVRSAAPFKLTSSTSCEFSVSTAVAAVLPSFVPDFGVLNNFPHRPTGLNFTKNKNVIFFFSSQVGTSS